ncbi:putative zinc-binding metallopeptidase [Kiritimatiellaeota bacterium B1221]|nr:putative zinc-binding metallopeptidase [Kiritimatiellaeota bacterium B1221]
MKLFQCENCGQVLHFENTSCEQCGYQVGFESSTLQLRSFQPSERRYCRNYEPGVCNWLQEPDATSDLCMACELNHYIPNVKDPEVKKNWRDIEFAKHRLVYSLLRLELPVNSKTADPENGLRFDFIDSDQVVPKDAERMTGHLSGKITLAIEEADPAVREQNRVNMKERYRTLLGHFRHEVGHYYWDLLILPFPERLQAFRDQFGDESIDYGQALEKHYQTGPPPQWNQNFISAYASSHPWEDWAESWSHYLHLVDTMETAYALGVSINPQIENQTEIMTMVADADPYLPIHFEDFLQNAVALTFAVNSINRSMGQLDLYPFILHPPVKQKLTFIHNLLKEVQTS